MFQINKFQYMNQWTAMGISPDIIKHLSNILLIECDTVLELSF
jgi:hypothetical protein